MRIRNRISDALSLAGTAALAGLILTAHAGLAFGGDADDDAGSPPTPPNVYLDMRTNYARVPAGSLATGLGGSGLFTALHRIVFMNSATPSALSVGRTTPPVQSAGVDLPLTVDVNDSVSLYAGISATSTEAGSGWSAPAITSWNVGIQAELYQQNGGALPTVTWQSTITQSVPNVAFATTTFTNIVELDYAFDEDETRGLLAGFQDTRVEVGSALARIYPSMIGYVGGYYQWPNNWKLTARAGMQHFGGAQLPIIAPIQPFTQPIVRFDLDRMDDNDNRLFGVTAQIMWVPKPAYQLTLRTPLYFSRN